MTNEVVLEKVHFTRRGEFNDVLGPKILIRISGLTSASQHCEAHEV